MVQVTMRFPTTNHEPRLSDVSIPEAQPEILVAKLDLTDLKDSQTPSPLESTACGSTDAEPSPSPKDHWMKRICFQIDLVILYEPSNL